MTKVTILGQEEPKKELKKIEVKFMLLIDGTWEEDDSDVSMYDNCVLIESAKQDGGYMKLDLFVVFDNNGSNKITFLGYFNDGIV